MSARVCSSCRRRVRWWQVWMPKAQQCLSCSVQLPDIRDVPCLSCQESPHTYCDTPYYCPCRQEDHQLSPSQYAERLVLLFNRGCSQEVVDMLWLGRNEELLAQIEKATPLEVAALNQEWKNRQKAKGADLPAAVAMPKSVSIDIWPRADGLRSVLLHPVKEVSVVPKMGQEVTVTYRVTRVDWRGGDES